MKKMNIFAILGAGLFFAASSPAFAQHSEEQGSADYDAEFLSTDPLPPTLTPPDDPGTAKAMLDPALAGDYFLQGMMETGSGLRLQPDGSFSWFLVVGSLDVFARGRWSANEQAILLVNDPIKPASQPYHFVSSSDWAEANDDEKKIGQGIASPSCYFGGDEPEPAKAKPFDQEIIIQIAFDPATLPQRDGKVRTEPYPLHSCSDVTVVSAAGKQRQTTYHYGYISATAHKGSTPSALIISNPQYAGANIRELKVDLPPLNPGVHRLWLDYKRFEPRMFDRLLLERSADGLHPYFHGRNEGGVYVKSDKDGANRTDAAAEDRAE